MRDIITVLKTGEIRPGTAEGDDVKGAFRVYGYDNDGDPLAVVVEIKEKLNRLDIFTGYGY
jgi:hypothetical protein